MKKIEIRKILSVVTVLAMICTVGFALAGCGSTDTETAGETETTAEATETTAEAEKTISVKDADYDIISELYEEGFDKAFPKEIDHSIKQDNATSVTVYLTSAKEDNCGGMVVNVMAFDADGEQSIDDFPDCEEIGTKNGVTYIAMYASDVQYNTEDSQQQKDYATMVDAAREFKIQ